jgi:hypothetical protein
MSLQTKVEKEKKELTGYSYICKKEDILNIQEGDYIKYYNETGLLKSGGMVVKNEYPEKIIIKYPQKDIFWAVSLEKNNCIYLKKIVKIWMNFMSLKKQWRYIEKLKTKSYF